MSIKDTKKFQEVIQSKGHRLTKARQRTFELLLNSEPQSITEIIARSAGSVDRVSVYRSIELFEKLGIINRIYTGWKYKVELSDVFRKHHHHISCTNCSKVVEFEEPDNLIKELKKLGEKNGFDSTSHTLELTGKCKSCA